MGRAKQLGEKKKQIRKHFGENAGTQALELSGILRTSRGVCPKKNEIRGIPPR
jgi:hypothetical protein